MTFNAKLIAVPQRINPLFVIVEVTLLKVYLNSETKTKGKNENALIMSSVFFVHVTDWTKSFCLLKSGVKTFLPN